MAQKIRNVTDVLSLLRKRQRYVLLAIHLSRDSVARHIQKVEDEKNAASKILRCSILEGTQALIIGRRTTRVEPIKEDDDLTQSLIEAGRIMGLSVLDHILLKNGTYYSFKENGRFFKTGHIYSYSFGREKRRYVSRRRLLSIQGRPVA